MIPKLKVQVSEIDGEELEFHREAFLSIQRIFNENPTDNELIGLDLKEVLIWLRKNGLYRRHFPEERVTVPVDHIMQMHSPVIDGEFYIEGEAYIL